MQCQPFDLRSYIPVLKDPDGGYQCNQQIEQSINYHDLAWNRSGRKR